MINMKVVKRSGESEEVSFDKILHRIRKLANDKNLGILNNVQEDTIAQEVISKIYDGISTQELDTLSSEIAISKSIKHSDYSTLATRLAISNLHKKTTECFSSIIEKLYLNKFEGEPNPLISKELYNVVKKNKKKINFAIDYSRDYLLNYIGFKTLEKSYLIKIEEKTIERPQHMWMRVSLGLHKGDLEKAFETYELMSTLMFTHATPTLFNAGTKSPALSSCFLFDIEDSMEGIYKNLSDCAITSKNAGGIGMNISDIRPNGTHIRGTNGTADGIMKMLRVFNETARYANQGSKRNGAFAFYLEPWHGDIFEFLEIKRNVGEENLRCRDLFTALWIPNNFMKAVNDNLDWYLMSPDSCPGLTTTYGSAFEELYNSYVKDGKFIKKIKARDLWDSILVAQIETGMPYISYKDHANEKTNQKNIGTIKSSNLCNEIYIASNTKEYGTCNISTVSLPKFVENSNSGPIYNFQKLYEIVRIMVRNMNIVIDINFYPVKEAKLSNLKHRPIAIGAQGLADTFFKMNLNFESSQAKQLNKEIYETIQYACLYESNKLAEIHGSYSSFEGSPASQGIFQHNLWGLSNSELSGKWDWDSLRDSVMKTGLRNSLLTASPPTASTSQILGNYESFEPVTSNAFMRSLSSGEYPSVNKYLIDELCELGIWEEKMAKIISKDHGSIQNFKNIPENIKNKYKTIWEISQKTLMEYSADRGLFTDHSQSLNLYFKEPTTNGLTSAHFHGWRLGLKTSMYYCRTLPKVNAEAFTVETETEDNTEVIQNYCSIDNPEACLSCSG